MIRDLLELGRSQARLHWSAARLRAYQDERVGAVARAAAAVPFWRERFAAARLDASRVRGIADLATFPPVRRAELAAAGSSRMLGSANGSAGYTVYRTSGTTGEPLSVHLDTGEVRAHRLVQFRALLATGFRARDRLVILGPSAALPSGLQQRLGLYRRDHIWPTLPVGQQVEALRRMHPDLLWIYPSLLHPVLEHAGGRLGNVCQPRAVVSSAEIFDRSLRDTLRSDGIESYDLYGTVEVGRIAWECSSHQGLHVNLDHVALEIVEDHGRCPETGARLGEVVVTSLVNRTTPIVRYYLGDIAGWLEGECACGSSFPRITYPLGRSHFLLRLPDGRSLAAVPLRQEFRRHPWIARFRIEQRSERRVRLLLKTHRAPGSDEIRALEREVNAYVQHQLSVDIELVDRLEPEAGTVKFREFIGLADSSQVKP